MKRTMKKDLEKLFDEYDMLVHLEAEWTDDQSKKGECHFNRSV